MAKVLVARDYDSFTGITEEFWHDSEANTVTIRRLMDIDPERLEILPTTALCATCARADGAQPTSAPGNGA